MTADEIKAALRLRHPIWQWAFFDELRLEMPSPTPRGYPYQTRSVDAWAMHCWHSCQFKRVAYEIKVSKADLQRELADPEKRLVGLAASNEFYWVLPENMDTPLLPAETGLIVVGEDGVAKMARRAPWRNTDLQPWVVAAVIRRACLLANGGHKNVAAFAAQHPYGMEAS